jgi:hypothetical protein
MSRKVFALAASLFAAFATAHAGDIAAMDAPAIDQATFPIDTPVLPVDSIVEGVSFGQWTAKWWQWAFAQPIAPFLDPDGRLCSEGQGGPVWFLAGTNGEFTPHRECVIPAGKYLLVPVINMIYMNHQAGHDPAKTNPCATLQTDAAVNNDHLISAVVMIDGVLVEDVARYRVRSDGCFPLTMDVDEASAQSAAADGYWLLLKPLPPGRHTISIGANYGAADSSYGHMLQNFEYLLDVGGRTDLAMRGDPFVPGRQIGNVVAPSRFFGRVTPVSSEASFSATHRSASLSFTSVSTSATAARRMHRASTT